jgi:hypothetical protein
MSHAKSDQEHLRSACRYVEQGMFQEAQAELEEIDPLCRHLSEILATRIPFYRALKKWDLIAVAAKMLAEWKPDKPGIPHRLGLCDEAGRINSRGPRDSDAGSGPASNRRDYSVQPCLLRIAVR